MENTEIPRNDMTFRLERILLPSDFSNLSAVSTKYACEFAARFNADLHLLHILDIRPPEYSMDPALPAYIRESRAAAEKAFANFLDPKWAKGRTVIHAVVQGSPHVEIIRYARSHDIDLIVLATHGRTGLPHLLIGSVAENVVRTAPCPVLTVRPDGHQFVMP